MKVVNLSGCELKDSQFEAIKISRYYRVRFDDLMRPILLCVNPSRVDDGHIDRLVRLVVEADRVNAGKVVIAVSILQDLRHRIAKAFLQKGYDVYTATLDGMNCTWIDPR